MDQKRNLLFGVVLLGLWFVWLSFGPKLFPGLFPIVEQAQKVAEKSDPNGDKKSDDDVESDSAPKTGAKDDEKPKFKLPDEPVKSVVLGSTDPASGYALQVELTSVGAAVVSATLNDARYPVAENPQKLKPTPQLRVVGNHLEAGAKITALDARRKPLTFDTAIPELDDQFVKLDAKASAKTLSWEVVSTEKDEKDPQITNAVTFRLKSVDDRIAVTKKYVLNRLAPDQPTTEVMYDLHAEPYNLDVALTFENRHEKRRTVDYLLQGPVGLPLEHAKIARKFRDIKAGFLSEKGSLTAQTLTAGEIVKAVDKQKVEEWLRPIRYMGVDVQFFAALVVPAEPQLEKSYFTSIKPVLISKTTNVQESEIGIEFLSQNLEIPGDGKLSHRFHLYLGPKRQELLDAHEAGAVFDYGWFGSISYVMVLILNFVHGWGVPYGIAIIILTGIVRSLMFPVSKKQASSGKKMKDLQPLMNELRERYKDDKQGMASAQMELYRKANFNPFGGCVLALIQLPIFIALYQALNNCVDLRMAAFLYFPDLSAPDSMFKLPFTVPWHSDDFNLLPLVTLGLYFVQQKMMMPPPTNDEMAMQQKMMNYMLIFMGFMFYSMPSGLCVYFIASTLWGMSERKLIDYLPEKKIDPEQIKAAPPAKEGFFSKLMKQVQQAAEQQQQLQREEEKRRKDQDKRR